MTTPNQLPLPGGAPDSGSPCLIDPQTGKPVAYGDARAEFERLSRQTPRDPVAEDAFIEHKRELIRSDPNLTDREKKQALQELERP